MALLEFGNKQTFGLDIGSYAVKVVQLRKEKSGYIATSAAESLIASNGETDQSRDTGEILGAIKSGMSTSQIRSRYAVCSVCGPEVFIKNFKFPPLSSNEIEQAVMLEAEQAVPFDIEQSVIDYNLLPGSDQSVEIRSERGRGPNLQGIIVAASEALVRERRQMAKKASLSCALMDVDGLALLNCFLETEALAGDQTEVVLNVGRTYTNLVFIRKGVPPFFRDLPHAGGRIIRALARDLNEPAEAVNKKLFTAEISNSDENSITASLSKASQKLISDITETMRYYYIQHKIKKVDRVLVCGGFAPARGLVHVLDSHLTADVELWDPFTRIRWGKGTIGQELLKNSGPAFAVAAGLAMRTL